MNRKKLINKLKEWLFYIKFRYGNFDLDEMKELNEEIDNITKDKKN